MDKTFEEWYAEANKFDCLEERVMDFGDSPCNCIFNHTEYKKVLKEAWDASCQNMTTRDI